MGVGPQQLFNMIAESVMSWRSNLRLTVVP